MNESIEQTIERKRQNNKKEVYEMNLRPCANMHTKIDKFKINTNQEKRLNEKIYQLIEKGR